MRYIKNFSYFDDFLALQESVSGSGKYVEDIMPGFAFVKENYPDDNFAFYNGHEETHDGYFFGDVIYTPDGTKLNAIAHTEYTASMGEKVGLVVIGSNEAPDGIARMMSFSDVMESGLSKEFSFWPDDWGTAFSSQTAYDGFAVYGLEDSTWRYGALNFMNENYPQPSSDENKNLGSSGNPLSDGEYYLHNPFVIGPFSGDGLNEKYFEELLYSEYADYNALSDFSGYTWSKMLYDRLTDKNDWTTPMDYTYGQYYTDGTNPNDWYVPSVGEMGFMVSRFHRINQIMLADNINGNPLSFTHYFNSTVMTYYKFSDSILDNILSPVFCGGGYDGDIDDERHGFFGYANNNSASNVLVRPFAMIQDNAIYREIGDASIDNGHRVMNLPNTAAS